MKVVIDIYKLPCKNGKSCTDCHFYTGDLCEVPAQLENFPKLEEKPHGEWIEKYCELFRYYCSICERGADIKGRFCPNCGADMRKEGE